MLDNFILPEKLSAEKVVMIKRNHSFDEQMLKVIDGSREFLRKYLFWVDKNRTMEDIVGATDFFANAWEKGDKFAYVVVDKSGNLLGCVDAHNIDKDNYSAAIGYFLSQDQTGKGYMSDAVKALEKAIFAQGIKRIEIRCDKENRASANVAIRNGYEHEASLKKAIYTYGEFHDEEIYVKHWD